MRQVSPQSRSVKHKGVDQTDLQILNLLQEDCLLSLNKVASKTGISVDTAYNCIKSLEADGYVKGYSVLVDSAKLGYTLTAVIFVQCEGENFSVVEKEIAQKNNVLAVYDVTGEFDAAVVAKFKDREDLNTFIKQLSAKANVKRTVTNVSLNTLKEDFRFKLDT